MPLCLSTSCSFSNFSSLRPFITDSSLATHGIYPLNNVVIYHFPSYWLEYRSIYTTKAPNGSEISLNYHIYSDVKAWLTKSSPPPSIWTDIEIRIIDEEDSMNNWCAFDRAHLVQHIPHFKSPSLFHSERDTFNGGSSVVQGGRGGHRQSCAPARQKFIIIWTQLHVGAVINPPAHHHNLNARCHIPHILTIPGQQARVQKSDD